MRASVRLRAVPKPPPADSPFWKLVTLASRLNTALFRATNGRLGGSLGGAPVLLLHHVGAKSGTPRTVPLLFLEDGGALVIVASKGGTNRHPAWYHNLRAHPDTEVELPGGERRRVRARVASEEERAALWPRLVAMYRPYEDYQRYTTRRIPLVILESS